MRRTSLAFAGLVLWLLAACGPDEVNQPIKGAEPNATDPQWVVQHSPRAEVAVVFIHGIFGDAIDTWTHASGTSFFQLLRDDPNLGAKLDLFAFGYTSKMLSGSSFTIQEAANKLHERLKYHGILEYPAIVFVAHSMGGLVTLRELLTHRDLLPRVPLIVFYATPQEGAQITVIANKLSANRALLDMLPADRNSFLQALNDEWKEVAKTGAPPIVCGYEKRDTYGIAVVPWTSATRFCSSAAVPIDADHLSIVKPDRPAHDSIVLLVNALNEYVIGQHLTAKLELPDFVREGERWTYTLRAPFQRQSARLVNAGRLPLRYTIAELSDPGLHIWPDDTPRTVAGNEMDSLWFALGWQASQSEFRFILRSDAAEDQGVTVRVPDLAQANAAHAAIVRDMTSDLNMWLADPVVRERLESKSADDRGVAREAVEQAYQSVARTLPDAPESLLWVMTAEALNAANWPVLAVEGLRRAEESSPTVVHVPSVEHVAAVTAAAAGESRVFTGVANPVLPPDTALPVVTKSTLAVNPEVAQQLSERLRAIPALRGAGLSLAGDVARERGDDTGAHRAYEDAARIRLTPSLTERMRVLRLPEPQAGNATGGQPVAAVPPAATQPEAAFPVEIVKGSQVLVSPALRGNAAVRSQTVDGAKDEQE